MAGAQAAWATDLAACVAGTLKDVIVGDVADSYDVVTSGGYGGGGVSVLIPR